MLRRGRVSRIFFNQKFFDYPITLKAETFRNMGFLNTMETGFSYLASCIHKRKENFSRGLLHQPLWQEVSLFDVFEHYTENLWGRHPSQIDPSWGAQRVKGVSISAVLKERHREKSGRAERMRKIETSLIEEFSYPEAGTRWTLGCDRCRGGEARRQDYDARAGRRYSTEMPGMSSTPYLRQDGKRFTETGRFCHFLHADQGPRGRHERCAGGAGAHRGGAAVSRLYDGRRSDFASSSGKQNR